MEPALHEDVAPLAFLLGTWEGEGSGDYPTVRPFRYRERMRFEHVGDAFLLYAQWSWLSADGEDDGMPLHFERGSIRPAPGGRVELTLAHPNGCAEVAEGSLSGRRIEVASTSVGRSATGDDVVALARRYTVDRDLLRYEVDMQTERTPLTRHLAAELRKAAP